MVNNQKLQGDLDKFLGLKKGVVTNNNFKETINDLKQIFVINSTINLNENPTFSMGGGNSQIFTLPYDMRLIKITYCVALKASPRLSALNQSVYFITGVGGDNEYDDFDLIAEYNTGQTINTFVSHNFQLTTESNPLILLDNTTSGVIEIPLVNQLFLPKTSRVAFSMISPVFQFNVDVEDVQITIGFVFERFITE